MRILGDPTRECRDNGGIIQRYLGILKIAIRALAVRS
jgi:hypothetical protein